MNYMEPTTNLHIKYFIKGLVLLKHCNAEFMKHVFPKLLSPHKPGFDVDLERCPNEFEA